MADQPDQTPVAVPDDVRPVLAVGEYKIEVKNGLGRRIMTVVVPSGTILNDRGTAHELGEAIIVQMIADTQGPKSQIIRLGDER